MFLLIACYMVCLSFAHGSNVIKLCTGSRTSIKCLDEKVILIKEVFRVDVSSWIRDHCGYQDGDHKEHDADITKIIWKNCNLWPRCGVIYGEATKKLFVEIHYECLPRTAIRMLSICGAGDLNMDRNQGYIHSPRYPIPIETNQFPAEGCKRSLTLSKPYSITVKVFNTFLMGSQKFEIQWDSHKEIPDPVPAHYKEYTYNASETFSVFFWSDYRDALFWLEYNVNELTVPVTTTTTPPKTTTKAAGIVSTTASTGTTPQPSALVPVQTNPTTTTSQDTSSVATGTSDSSSTVGTSSHTGTPEDIKATIPIILGTTVPVILIIVVVTVVIFVRRRRKAAREKDKGKDNDNNNEKLEFDFPNRIYEEESGRSNTGFEETSDRAVFDGPTALYSSPDEVELQLGSQRVEDADQDRGKGRNPEDVRHGQVGQPSGRPPKPKVKPKVAVSLKVVAEFKCEVESDDVPTALYSEVVKGKKATTKGPNKDADQEIVGIHKSIPEGDFEQSESGKGNLEMKAMSIGEPEGGRDDDYADIYEVNSVVGRVDTPTLEQQGENDVPADEDEGRPGSANAVVGKTSKKKPQKKIEGAKKGRGGDELAPHAAGAVYAEVVKAPKKRREVKRIAGKVPAGDEVEEKQVDDIYAEVDETLKPKYRLKPEVTPRNIKGATDPATATGGEEYSHLQRGNKNTKTSSKTLKTENADVENESSYDNPVWNDDDDLYSSSSFMSP